MRLKGFPNFYIHRVSNGPPDIMEDNTLSPTWISTASFDSSEAAIVYANILQKYRWTSLYFLVNRGAIALFSGAAEALHNRLSLINAYQTTYAVIDTADRKELDDTLLEFIANSRSRT